MITVSISVLEAGLKFQFWNPNIKNHCEDFVDEACSLFASTSFGVTTKGCPYLGAPLGSMNSILPFSRRKYPGVRMI